MSVRKGFILGFNSLKEMLWLVWDCWGFEEVEVWDCWGFEEVEVWDCWGLEEVEVWDCW
jgi:hypothetical protein